MAIRGLLRQGALFGPARLVGQARRAVGSRHVRRSLFILIIAIVGQTTRVWAQAPTLPIAAVTASAAAEPEPNTVRLMVGRSTGLDVRLPIARGPPTRPHSAA